MYVASLLEENNMFHPSLIYLAENILIRLYLLFFSVLKKERFFSKFRNFYSFFPRKKCLLLLNLLNKVLLFNISVSRILFHYVFFKMKPMFLVISVVLLFLYLFSRARLHLLTLKVLSSHYRGESWVVSIDRSYNPLHFRIIFNFFIEPRPFKLQKRFGLTGHLRSNYGSCGFQCKKKTLYALNLNFPRFRLRTK